MTPRVKVDKIASRTSDEKGTLVSSVTSKRTTTWRTKGSRVLDVTAQKKAQRRAADSMRASAERSWPRSTAENCLNNEDQLK